MPRRDETPRDLLFGLLALQNGLIDQDQLVAAFSAWSRAKGRTLAEILIERGAIDEESRSLLAAMAEKQLKLHGGTEKSLASIAVGPSTRQKLSAVGDTDLTASLAHVRDQTPTDLADGTPTMSIGTTTSEGGRFRVLRPHARGGLGAVFVALDGELNREVALKQILDHHADDEHSRTRFLIEAEITGGLEHPGIVPVYGLGHHADGRPYYAMRFIRGDSLKEAIEAFHEDEPLKSDPGQRSLALRKLLRRFGDVCNAIDYAHGRGVLHRDIKPGNVIVGKHGETLVVDWGLAKPMGQSESASSDGERTLMPSSSSGSADTLPRQAIGTPAYMSPELALGDLDRLGPRSDVYSLGATLYSLLTGKAPFEGFSLGEVLNKVQKGMFPPPRQLDPAIDRALEAVCLKAMALNPDDRHATARALAEDVERWAADEPTSAWVEPTSVKVRRWMKRNRTAVTAAAVAVLAAVVGLSAVLAVQRRANTALDLKNRALDQANGDLRESNRQKDAANAALALANGKVQARFELAREAIHSFKAGVEQDETLKNDSLKPLRDKLLGSARRFYDKLGDLLQGQADAASKAVLAESYRELGELIDQIGQKPESLAAFKKAVAIRRELAAMPGAGPSERIELARALNAQGEEAQQLNDHAGGLAAHEEARALAEPLATGPGATLAARRALGDALDGAGQIFQVTGKSDAALATYKRAREILEPLSRDPAAVPADRGKLANSYNRIGGQLETRGDIAGALAEFRKSQELTRALVAENPAVAQYRSDLAESHDWIGFLLHASGDTAGGLAEFRKSQELTRALVAENPAVARYRSDLAASHNQIGTMLQASGDTAGALAEFRKYQDLMRALVAESPAVADYRRELAVSHNWSGFLLRASGDTAGALAELRKSQDLTRALVAESPAVAQYRNDLAFSYNRIGDLLQATGDTAGALAEFRKAQDLMRALVAESPAVADYRRDLARSHNLMGALLVSIGKAGEAVVEVDQGRALFEALVEASPKVDDYRDRLAGILNLSGDALLDLGRADEARDRYARAVALAEALASANPNTPDYRYRLATGLRRLAPAKLAAGDAAGASADARRAVGLYEGLPYREGGDWFGLGCARATLSAAAGREGSGISADEGPVLADRAMADLRQAAATGYRNSGEFRREPALNPLRARDDFRLLMLDLAFPADVFAR